MPSDFSRATTSSKSALLDSACKDVVVTRAGSGERLQILPRRIKVLTRDGDWWPREDSLEDVARRVGRAKCQE